MPPAPEDHAEFPATHWTLIARAAGPARDTALSRLYRTYWRPLCAQARRFGVREQEVEDVVQDLMVSFLAGDSLGRARPETGRFRSYLLGALRNHLSHRRARAHTLKRGAAQAAVPIDSLEAAQTPATAPFDTCEFDAAWARALIEEALRRFETEERHSEESRASFGALGGCVLGADDVPYEDAAGRLGITVAAVKSRVFRLRQRFRDIVREEVRRTVATESECDGELRYLCEVLDKVNGVPALESAR